MRWRSFDPMRPDTCLGAGRPWRYENGDGRWESARYRRDMRPDQLCGVLAEPERLRAFAAIVLGAGTSEVVAERAGLPARSAVVAVRRLVDSGLVMTDGDGGLVAEVGVFKQAVREHAPEPELVATLDPDAKRDAVLRSFVKDGRIVAIPAAKGKRRILLEYLVTAFQPGVRFPESVVNERLNAWHDDHAALRRYLVNEGLMHRVDGVYWRAD